LAPGRINEGDHAQEAEVLHGEVDVVGVEREAVGELRRRQTQLAKSKNAFADLAEVGVVLDELSLHPAGDGNLGTYSQHFNIFVTCK
jgi:hypothetical protein